MTLQILCFHFIIYFSFYSMKQIYTKKHLTLARNRMNANLFSCGQFILMFVVKLDELNWLINDIEHAHRYVI